jgi:hypothetical protein
MGSTSSAADWIDGTVRKTSKVFVIAHVGVNRNAGGRRERHVKIANRLCALPLRALKKRFVELETQARECATVAVVRVLKIAV